MLRYTEYKIAAEDRPQHRYEYWVTGRGEFPVDMLRYDNCWPADTDSAIMMSFDSKKEMRNVRLRSYKMPTEGRWSSFNWSVGKNSV